MATLTVLSEGVSPAIFPIAEPSCVLGRKADCHIVVAYNGNENVSRHHARIEKVGDQFLLVDLKSRNGTKVNGERISQIVVLREGDVISICDVDFRLSFAGTDSSGQVTKPAWSHSVLEEDSSSIKATMKVQPSGGSDGYSQSSAETRFKALLEMLVSLGRTLELDDVLSSLLAEVLKIIPLSDSCVIGLWNENRATFEIASAVNRRPTRFPVTVSQSILREVARSKQAILFDSARNDPRLSGSNSVRESGMWSAMGVPLIDQDGQLIGVIQVDTRHPSTQFKDIDLEVLVGVAPVILVAFRYSQLHKRLLVQRSIEQELAAAHRVQRSLLPRQDPAVPGYEFFPFYNAALQVGGDYYDYIHLPDGRLAVVLADAAGKGISAALYIASISGELKFRLAAERSAAEAVNRINRYLCENKAEQRFVTMVLAILDPRNHEVSVFNAGHFAPLLRNADGRVVEFGAERRGFALGVVPEEQYLESTLTLAPGDSLVMFTDGFSDAINDREERYGTKRIREQVSAPCNSLTELGEQIVRDVHDFMGRTPQCDDMCLVSLGRHLGHSSSDG